MMEQRAEASGAALGGGQGGSGGPCAHGPHVRLETVRLAGRPPSREEGKQRVLHLLFIKRQWVGVLNILLPVFFKCLRLFHTVWNFLLVGICVCFTCKEITILAITKMPWILAHF